MNKNHKKMEGYGNALSGKVKETAGKMMGNSDMRLKGKAQKMKGKMQVAAVDAKNSVQNSMKGSFKRAY